MSKHSTSKATALGHKRSETLRAIRKVKYGVKPLDIPALTAELHRTQAQAGTRQAVTA